MWLFLLPAILLTNLVLKTEADWKGDAKTILCQAGGDKESKSADIIENLKSKYKDSFWYVLVTQGNQGHLKAQAQQARAQGLPHLEYIHVIYLEHN